MIENINSPMKFIQYLCSHTYKYTYKIREGVKFYRKKKLKIY